MKISKLFHWLYATLMFLPFIFLLPTLAYYGFNEHAVNTQSTAINYKYESNEVNSVADVLVGHIYEFKIDYDTIDVFFDSNICEFNVQILQCKSYDFDSYSLSIEDSQTVLDFLVFYDTKVYFDLYQRQGTITTYLTDDYLSVLSLGDLTEYPFNLDFIVYVNSVIGLQDYSILTYTDYNVIESVDIDTSATISAQINDAWNTVWNLPLFSWTHNSFVSEPFTYITGLFGMSDDNPFNYVVTYFVSISVCWLVFDFLMYVPNLAHRWLDKGALE